LLSHNRFAPLLHSLDGNIQSPPDFVIISSCGRVLQERVCPLFTNVEITNMIIVVSSAEVRNG
jgi:hypothetical protein